MQLNLAHNGRKRRRVYGVNRLRNNDNVISAAKGARRPNKK